MLRWSRAASAMGLTACGAVICLAGLDDVTRGEDGGAGREEEGEEGGRAGAADGTGGNAEGEGEKCMDEGEAGTALFGWA